MKTPAHTALAWLRSALLRRCVSTLFFASVGIAHAGLLLKPQSVELLCAPSGAMKLLVTSADGDAQTSTHAQHCALCALHSLAEGLPLAAKALPESSGGADIPCTPSTSASAAHAAPPLPARGPPFFPELKF